MPGLDKMREHKATMGTDTPTSEADPNIIVDDDGFLVGVRVPSDKPATGKYVLNDGRFAGYALKYRALLSIDHELHKGSPVSSGMVNAKLDPQDKGQRDAYVGELTSVEHNQIYTEATSLIVLDAVEVLSAAPPERCPLNRISIQELSKVDLMMLRVAIEDLSGVRESEATFPETDAEDSTDPDESESSGEAESDDSGDNSASVGESTE